MNREIDRLPDSVAWVHLSFEQYYTILIKSHEDSLLGAGPLTPFSPDHPELLLLLLAVHTLRRLQIDARHHPKSLWFAAANEARYLPYPGLKDSKSSSASACALGLSVSTGERW